MAASGDIAAAARGDRPAFARLYGRYHRAVFIELVARLRRTQDAEDALQATFLAAWTNLPKLRRQRRFVAWLFRIARNKAADQMRREQPRLVLLGDDMDRLAPTPSDGPDVEALRALVAGLQPKSRAIVLLRTVEGWSAEEVATAKGLSISTVRRHYANAIEHLRTGLERNEEDDEGNRTSRRVQL